MKPPRPTHLHAAPQALTTGTPPSIAGFDMDRWNALSGIKLDQPWNALPDHVHRTSAGRPWQGLAVWHQVGPVGDLYVPAQNSCVVLVRRGTPTHLTQRIGDAYGQAPWHPGEAVITPCEMPSFWRSTAVRDNIHLSLSPAWLQRAAAGEVTLAPCFGRRDPVLSALADLLLSSLDNNVSLQPEFGEHMAMAIALHLIENYAVPSERVRATSSLSSRQMRQITDAVMVGLHEPWPVQRLASLVSLSSFHFSRAFKISFGASPHAWVQFQRMELAARLVRNSSQALADIAVATGHPSAAHFSHAFRRHWGVTPSDYRRS